jgi:hypothetical protein
MDWSGRPGVSREFRSGCGTAPTTASPEESAASPDSPAASLADLLKMRAAAQGAGLPDLERQLREQIRVALPICRIDPESGEPIVEKFEDPQQADLPAPEEEALIELFAPSSRPGTTRIGQLATLPKLEGRRSERRVLNLAADLREDGASIAEVEVTNISKHGFLISSDSPLELEIGSFAWLKLPGFEPFKSQVVRAAGGRLGGRFLTPLYPAVLQLILKEEPKARQRRLFHPPRPVAAA